MVNHFGEDERVEITPEESIRLLDAVDEIVSGGPPAEWTITVAHL